MYKWSPVRGSGRGRVEVARFHVLIKDFKVDNGLFRCAESALHGIILEHLFHD